MVLLYDKIEELHRIFRGKYYKKNMRGISVFKFKRKPAFARLGKESFVYNPFVISGSESIAIGDHVTILDNARISVYEQKERGLVVQIDDGCYIGYYFSLLAKAKVHIEKNVLIASHVLISSENHGMNPECNEYYMDQPLVGKEVKVGEGTWIGEKVCILPGVQIGKKCVIGAGSVVTKSIPDYCIAAGNPARVIKKWDFTRHEWVPAGTR